MIKKYLNRLFIDGLSGMAYGLFSTLIIALLVYHSSRKIICFYRLPQKKKGKMIEQIIDKIHNILPNSIGPHKSYITARL